MSFKTRQIRQKPPLQPLKKLKAVGSSMHSTVKKLPSKTLNYIATGALVLVGFFVVFKVSVGAYHFVSGLTPGNLISAVSSELEADSNGYTNILLLGDGGYTRDGAGLADTIIVASIDQKKNIVSMLSIPRDFYLTKKNDLGLGQYGKINEIYINNSDLGEDEGYQVFKQAVGKLVNLDIQYYMRIDFKGFVEIVDSLGGITVDVPNDIYDATYPNATDTGVITFKIKAGLQELDGETALKFARSRHDLGGASRDVRQQLILQAIQQKALSKDILTDLGALDSLYQAVTKNFNTDMTLRELAGLGEIAQNIDRSRVVSRQLHDDPSREGGFLYVPPKEQYGGAFAFIPEGGDLTLIHRYTDLLFNHREVYIEPAKIEILNATKLSGIASQIAYDLTRFGLDVEKVGNNLDPAGEKKLSPTSSVVYHEWTEDKKGGLTPKFQSTLDVLSGFFMAPAQPSESSFPVMQGAEDGKDKSTEKTYEGQGMNVSIILGDDYKDFLPK